ncbi:MAG: methyltransferase domain-containing protein [Emcibacter sp.]|nr:methyltransferase domain-containing protein [Emcibacter sp.]
MKTKKKSAHISRTLGPLSDLERHLPEEWWRSLFNAVYLSTDGDVVENDENTHREVDLLVEALNLKNTDKILDLCCGQGRHTIELAKRGYKNLTGLDRSNYLIRLAKRRAKSADLVVQFKEGDARRFSLPENSFDGVFMMGNSFGYFDREEDDLAVLSSIKKVLKSEGKIAIDLVDGDWIRQNFEPRSWEWIDKNQFVCRERSLSSNGDKLISREVVTHAEHGVIADQFYAERLYSKSRIEKLLKEAGFSDIVIHAEIETLSSRDEDLGMMARRNFLTARGPLKAAVKTTKKALIDVTVLLGDPQLPDSVKLEGQFNADDFVTIHKLKEALSKIEGFHFRYIDNHATLQNSLKGLPSAFVLNFCDEGYSNKASLELHVPAYLEMLNIPYSGANPQSLAICYNKAIVRYVAMACDIPVPLETYFGSEDQAFTIPSILPALIKPCEGDSSIGITSKAVVYNANEGIDYITHLQEILPGIPILVQEFLKGREFSVGLIGNVGLGFKALPILEVDYSELDEGLPPILGYESKWDPSSPYWTEIKYKQATIADEQYRNLVDWSKNLFERLGCRDYARFDFRADAEGTIKLLEVNPNPGWCWDGKLNLMASFAGYDYSGLLKLIIDATMGRLKL